MKLLKKVFSPKDSLAGRAGRFVRSDHAHTFVSTGGTGQVLVSSGNNAGWTNVKSV